MSESKETTGKALTVEFDTYSMSTGGNVWIAPGLIAKALLANPEAREAVLAALGHVEEVEARVVAGLQKRATEAEARLASALGKYGELQKLTESWSDRARDDSGGDMFDEGIMRCARELKAELAALPFRDQALSAPTADSGKDSASPPPSDAERCKRTVHSFKGMVRCLLAEGHGGFHSYDEPAPVAEAEGRVTHLRAKCTVEEFRASSWWEGLGRAVGRGEELLRYISQQQTREEQSEREAVELRKELAANRDKVSEACHWLTQRDELKAKLAESDRKLAEASLTIETLERMLADSQAQEKTASYGSLGDIEADMAKTDCSVSGCGDLARTYGLCFAHAAAAGRDAAHARTAAEPAKPELPLDAARHRMPGLFTPPAAEAPPELKEKLTAMALENVTVATKLSEVKLELAEAEERWAKLRTWLNTTSNDCEIRVMSAYDRVIKEMENLTKGSS